MLLRAEIIIPNILLAESCVDLESSNSNSSYSEGSAWEEADSNEEDTNSSSDLAKDKDSDSDTVSELGVGDVLFFDFESLFFMWKLMIAWLIFLHVIEKIFLMNI